jgi:hypothetical protein
VVEVGSHDDGLVRPPGQHADEVGLFKVLDLLFRQMVYAAQVREHLFEDGLALCVIAGK